MEAVLSGSFDTICLLNPIIKIHKMPTIFNDVNHQFVYLHHTGLVITGAMPLVGLYSVSLIPKSNSCAQKTFDELKSKKLN